MHKKYFFYSVVFLFFSCKEGVSQSGLKFISKSKIVVSEPSGITFYDGSLFVVGDANSCLYQLTTKGLLVKKHAVSVKQMEGVTFDVKRNSFVLLSESKRAITFYSLSKGKEKTYKIKGKQKESNKGLEGICYNIDKESLFIVNESAPKQLLKITRKGKIKKKYDLKFAKDISGIVYDSVLKVYWVLSDESKALYKVSLKGKMIQKFPINIEKVEGIALGDDRRLYIVSDLSSELFTYVIE